MRYFARELAIRLGHPQREHWPANWRHNASATPVSQLGGKAERVGLGWAEVIRRLLFKS